ncbi:phytanoyl-CoA dioxygenase family protein [Variovorax humicola]|jgi:hypothetical protein|uniref:Phytanoyl-CoA dioxygenase family protein n=1 Tax=Variovorax humicola TaxID=1769758 RepID=A0ABU8VW06_9BURK
MTEQQTTFERDGVVRIPAALTGHWLDEARKCFEWSIAHPGPRSSNYTKGDSGTFYVDTGNPEAFDGYATFLERAPLKDRVREAMGTRELWFAFEQVFFKEGGAEKAQRTAWHQDTSYLSFDGPHLAVLWMSFDPVPRESALEFVRGSHKGPLYEQRGVATTGLPTVPRIEDARDRFDILGWATEPGDALMFHPSILHGGGPTRSGQRRRTLSLRFFGDKAFYLQRQFGKDTPECFRELRLENGQPFRGEAFRALP